MDALQALLPLLLQVVQQQQRLVNRVLEAEKHMALTQAEFDQKLQTLVAVMAQLQQVVTVLAQRHAGGADLTTEGATVDQLVTQVQTSLNEASQALAVP